MILNFAEPGARSSYRVYASDSAFWAIAEEATSAAPSARTALPWNRISLEMFDVVVVSLHHVHGGAAESNQTTAPWEEYPEAKIGIRTDDIIQRTGAGGIRARDPEVSVRREVE